VLCATHQFNHSAPCWQAPFIGRHISISLTVIVAGSNSINLHDVVLTFSPFIAVQGTEQQQPITQQQRQQLPTSMPHQQQTASQ